MSRPRSNSDPSADNNKDKAPPAPSLSAVLKPHIANWGQKSSTGYVGLSNQGATCYLNSLLQCLYMTPEFRHALFTWRYKPPPNTQFEFDFMDAADSTDTSAAAADGDDSAGGIYDEPPEHSIMFQLQCLFARLHQSVRGACSTKPLTKSFHWDDGQAFQQHDVQELLRVLFDAVSRTLSRVGKGDLLNDLCKGVLLDYLDCQTCHNDRSREDIFLDLSLTIENISSLEDALQGFIAPELMEKDNRVNCTQCASKQDFKKGLKFRKLPPLLIIQLKRFHYDWQLDRRVKLSHRVSFPRQLEMSAFLADDILQSTPAADLQYTLYGVILQSGGALGGHYFANIKSFDKEQGEWYRFNDASVRTLDEDKEFDDAFGGENIRGTGYVLLYRRTNLKLPTNYGYFPSYLARMVEKEDAAIKVQWERWQKEMRSITLCVQYPQAKPRPQPPSDGDGDAKEVEKEQEEDENPILAYSENGTQVTLKLDVEEWTFMSLLKLVRTAFEIGDDEIAIENTRLRKYHVEYDFVAEGYDDVNIATSKIEIAKWPKRGLTLRLETKQSAADVFTFFDADDILIKLFVVDSANTAELVDRGFVQSATFKSQELPRGGECTAVINSKKLRLSQVKVAVYAALKQHAIVPAEWLNECGDDEFDAAQQLNLLRFDYNKVTIFNDDAADGDNGRSLSDFNVKMGSMLFVEKKTALKSAVLENGGDSEDAKLALADIPLLSPSYQRSPLAIYFEEQRLKISVTFNDPLPAQSVQDKLEQLLMTPQMLQVKKQLAQTEVTTTTTTRLEFTHAVRISKECTLRQLKTRIASELQLDMNTFRLRKNSTAPELRDMQQTLNAAGIHDGGLVYVEHGVPTGPRQTCVTFALYDPHKLLTDPHKKKKTLAQKLFEWPFERDLKISQIKTRIVAVLNELFPLYRGCYNFPQAIKALKEEEEARNQREIEEMKKATELSKNTEESKQTEEKETEEEEHVENTESEQKEAAVDKDKQEKKKNIFGIEHVRLRKQKGAKVMEMYFDDQTLSAQCVKKDAIQIVIEKIPIAEHFTKNHLCFWSQKYRPDQGKNGKVYKKREFVIDKRSTMIDLKMLIARLLKKSDAQHYGEIDDAEIVRNISVTKGLSVTPMNATNVLKRQWVHRAALMQVGIDAERYFYKLSAAAAVDVPEVPEVSEQAEKNAAPPLSDDVKSTEMKGDEERFTAYDGNTYNDAEILAVMQHALASENDDIVSRTPFHLRNGDLIVWTDIAWRPTEAQIAERQKQEQENASKIGGQTNKKNGVSKNSSVAKKGFKRAEAGGIKIRTYEEYLEDEQRKKEEEAQRKLEKEKLMQKDTAKDIEKDTETVEKSDLLEKKILFNAMVAEDVNDLQNPKPTKRMNRTGSF